MNVKEFSVIATLSPEERQLLVNEVVEALRPLLAAAPSSATQDQEKPISKKEACQLLRCSEPTITKFMAEGKIPFYRKGRRVYFFKSEVLQSLEQPLRRA
ncbi:excisionase family DNA binding protein [Pontibacter ummariensis]|uniref:DNA binding domain-containing protein, excisionase family n=1 Tax=Pontibacter ummariensis TaxID=1610492 RepID=A0A239DEL1_9BACT|nr:helix-turn-helix domain-containing protein [Pontibacter ummariensis]PRY14366.1 excisionase family DNA binding protein [Pontibacter ummariensis]SNS30254.1 DNA binding domain-containing protein, excisionase family [Pontibacter ummariensis]